MTCLSLKRVQSFHSMIGGALLGVRTGKIWYEMWSWCMLGALEISNMDACYKVTEAHCDFVACAGVDDFVACNFVPW